MKYSIIRSTFRHFLLGIAIIGIFSSCGREVVKPTPDDFTFEVRENLGSKLSDAIANNETSFPILDKEEYADNVYRYMDTMMGQVSNLYRYDLSGSSWNQEKEWEAYVIHNDEDKIAFCIPGGDFYISTGFLKVIERDFELYYVMAFELTMMQNEVLLNNLYSLGIEDIAAISAGTAEPGDLSADDVALSFLDPEFVFDSAMVEEMDKLTMDYICQTSDYNRFGIIDLINNTQNIESLWFDTRPNYANRDFANLSDVEVSDLNDCGNLKSTDQYESLLLQFLP